MKNILLILVAFGINSTVYSQTNENKVYKRWIYLDKNWKTIVDTSDYAFKRLTTIEGKTNIHPMGTYGKKDYTLKINGETSIENSKVLNGTYTWYDKSGIKKSEHVFLNGEYINGKEFWKNGKIKKHFDFTTHPKEDSLAYYVYTYNKKMTVLEVFTYQRDKNGNWPRTR